MILNSKKNVFLNKKNDRFVRDMTTDKIEEKLI